jgi:hypothetical protein
LSRPARTSDRFRRQGRSSDDSTLNHQNLFGRCRRYPFGGTRRQWPNRRGTSKAFALDIARHPYSVANCSRRRADIQSRPQMLPGRRGISPANSTDVRVRGACQSPVRRQSESTFGDCAKVAQRVPSRFPSSPTLDLKRPAQVSFNLKGCGPRYNLCHSNRS